MCKLTYSRAKVEEDSDAESEAHSASEEESASQPEDESASDEEDSDEEDIELLPGSKPKSIKTTSKYDKAREAERERCVLALNSVLHNFHDSN